MLSTMLAWKYVLPLLFAVALLGGVIGGAAVHYAFEDDKAEFGHGSIVHLGSPENLYGNPFCIEAQHLCIAQLEGGQILALYMYDTHAFFRSQSCSVTWRPDMSFTDPATGEETKGWFRSGCSGSTFRLDGERIFGPSSRDLDRFNVRVLGPNDPLAGYLEVDTRHLICGRDRSDVNSDCDFAPLPQ